MLLLLVIGTALCAMTAVLVVRAVRLPRLRAAASVQQVGAYGFPVRQTRRESAGRLTEALDRLAERLGAAMLPRLSGAEEANVRKLLVSAGMYGLTPGRFLGYRLMSAAGLLAVWMWFGPTGDVPTALFIVSTPVVALAGWTIPFSLVRVRAENRLEEIDHELPELIDSLVVTVEAGVGFNGALRLAARDLRGPLGDEINLTLQEQGMGLSLQDALRNLIERVELPAMQSFVRAVLQGESLGVSIGEIMRGLAIEMRARRRAKAEERAHKAPVKMLFPLAFCIFPAILIVLLFPAVREFSRALG